MIYHFELILFSKSVCLFQPKKNFNTLSETQALEIKKHKELSIYYNWGGKT